MVDLDLIPRDRKYAVHCQNKEEADMFLAAMREHYPEKCVTWRGDSHWSEINDCYNPNFYIDRNLGSTKLFYDSRLFYESQEYSIIEFSDICIKGELIESGQSIDFLFI